MHFTFDPSISYRRYFYNSYPSNACDVEINVIGSKCLDHKCDISIDETISHLNCIKIDVKELNHHIGHVEIYPGNLWVCSCEQYRKTGTGFCKHIGLVKYVIKFPSFKDEFDFSHLIKNHIKNLKISSTEQYMVYDSYNDIILSYGLGTPINSSSTENLIKHIKHKSLPTPISLPNPYTLTPSVSLFDYQREILEKMINNKRGICSMVMGAGKTISAIAGIHHLNTTNVLIVCPKSIMKQWESEITRILGLSTTLIDKYNILSFAGIGICTYQTLSRNIDLFSKRNFDLIIADEIQFIRNDESKTWAAFKKLKSDYFWGLSGTVIENRLDDLYNIMDVISPDLFGPKWKFDAKFKKLKSLHKFKSLYENEIQNKEDLKKLISNNVFSYDKLTLPKITHNIIKVKLNSPSKKLHDDYIYKANLLISKSLKSKITATEKMLIQAYLLKARQICNTTELIDGNIELHNPKIDKILDIVENVCIKNNQKLVIFSEWTEMLGIIEREIYSKFKLNYVRFDGSMNPQKRFEAVEKFKNDINTKIFFSSDAGGLGLDGLQLVSSNILHVELPWNPAKLDQRNGRLHRILQTNPVNVYYVYNDDSIESKIWSLLGSKRQIRMDALF